MQASRRSETALAAKSGGPFTNGPLQKDDKAKLLGILPRRYCLNLVLPMSGPFVNGPSNLHLARSV
jgi:hypothetical protein